MKQQQYLRGGAVPCLAALSLLLSTSIGLAQTGTPTAGASAKAPVASASAKGPVACFPACRSTYVCVEGRCVSACNPPCAANERCTTAVTCEVVAPAAVAPPVAAPAATAPPPATGAPAPEGMPAPIAPVAPLETPVAVAPAAAPVNALVPLRIDAPRGRYDVSVIGKTSVHCQAPCTLQVPPGPATLLVSGDAELKQDIVVPTYPSAYAIETRSKGKAVVGGVLLGIGGVITIVVAVNNSKENPSVDESESNLYLAVVGLGITVTGAILFLTAGSNKLKPATASAEKRSEFAKNIGLWAVPARGGGAVVGGALRF